MRERELVLDGKGFTALSHELGARGLGSSLEDVFFLPLPESVLTPEQREHKAGCGPHVLALEFERTGDTHVGTLDDVVRALGRLHCTCMGRATPEQTQAAWDMLDGVLEELGIPSQAPRSGPSDRS